MQEARKCGIAGDCGNAEMQEVRNLYLRSEISHLRNPAFPHFLHFRFSCHKKTPSGVYPQREQLREGNYWSYVI